MTATAALKVSNRKKEEMTSPISTPIEVGMVTTRAQQLTLTQCEEEEALTQARDGPEIHTLDPCYKGKQMEESEGKDEEMAIPSPEPELEWEKGVNRSTAVPCWYRNYVKSLSLTI